MDAISKNLSCNDSTNSELSSIPLFIYVHDHKSQEMISLSIEPLPISVKTTQLFKIKGYSKISNHLVFYAVDNFYKGTLPLLDTINTLKKLDSLMKNTYNYNWSWGDDFKVYYYFYYYITCEQKFNKNKGRISYTFFNDFNKIPKDIKCTENHFLVEGNYFPFQYYELNKYYLVNSVFKINCGNYFLLSDQEKEKLFSGTIKIKFNP